jgi:predicted SnoaL-like aldol condensation-catalyzing enzyme
LTARNKALVRDFYTTVLIGRNDAASRSLRPDYIQHNPDVPTGLKGFVRETGSPKDIMSFDKGK